MLKADGVLALWNRGGSKATGVVAEVDFALERDLDLCLLRQRLVDLPKNWPKNKLWTLLRGVDRLLSFEYTVFSKWTCVESGDMDEMVDEMATFAWRAKVRRAARTGSP
ncbi:MAG: hypothetical protein ABR888_07285 [Thermoplasmata archaeon]|jgi:hypothetical protein